MQGKWRAAGLWPSVAMMSWWRTSYTLKIMAPQICLSPVMWLEAVRDEFRQHRHHHHQLPSLTDQRSFWGAGNLISLQRRLMGRISCLHLKNFFKYDVFNTVSIFILCLIRYYDNYILNLSPLFWFPLFWKFWVKIDKHAWKWIKISIFLKFNYHMPRRYRRKRLGRRRYRRRY